MSTIFYENILPAKTCDVQLTITFPQQSGNDNQDSNWMCQQLDVI